AEAASSSTKFITSASDWLSEPDNTLWSGDNAQGPCPDGWRVPTADELSVLSFGTSTNRLAIAGTVPGEYLYLPAAGGCYSSGGWYAQGSGGHYWSSTVNGTNAKYLTFYGTPNVTALNRAYGFSVRCIQK
ncbi:MAG: fibrobacter succinogenes major paralogous domain-containing protein, partial [Prevotella sp.]|nr:fibrobacter succinogenes major paralogous domain-containing protein [Prevotella sp.]